MAEAEITETTEGLVARGEGWYVINAAEAVWQHVPEAGCYCALEGAVRFTQVGINLNMLLPGEASSLYHAEENQEGFLILAGECLLVVDGQERRLRAWDFFHCAPRTAHVLIGAGETPCLFVAVGARRKAAAVVYPVSETAVRHRAGVTVETTSPAEAYTGLPASVAGRAPDLPPLQIRL
jgi:uncharacterized cupin superfamily protein